MFEYGVGVGQGVESGMSACLPPGSQMDKKDHVVWLGTFLNSCLEILSHEATRSTQW